VLRFFTEICGATTSGGAASDSELTFSPASVRAGTFRVELSGSEPALRLLRAAAVALGRAPGAVEVSASGSTHAPDGEVFEVTSATWVRLARRIGLEVEVELELAGFAPKGGGEVRMRLPGRCERLEPLDVPGGGKLEALQIVSAASSLPAHVQQRQAARARSAIRVAGVEPAVQLVKLRAAGSGSTVAVTGVFDGLPLTVGAVSERGKSAEAVGEVAAREFRRLASVRGALPPVLLPSLLLAAALSDGRSRLVTHRLPVSIPHVADVVRAFTGREVRIEGKAGSPGAVTLAEPP
jgi:RNA 3'-terminal phosphate cyclase (ATP)